MARTLTKHVGRRQEQTFADWFAELRESLRATAGPTSPIKGKPFMRSGVAARHRKGPLHGGTYYKFLPVIANQDMVLQEIRGHRGSVWVAK